MAPLRAFTRLLEAGGAAAHADVFVEALPTVLRLLVHPLALPPAAQLSLALGSLECVSAAPLALPQHAVEPLRLQVLKTVRGPLDHRKRAVRQAAARCANGWHTLGAGSAH